MRTVPAAATDFLTSIGTVEFRAADHDAGWLRNTSHLRVQRPSHCANNSLGSTIAIPITSLFTGQLLAWKATSSKAYEDSAMNLDCEAGKNAEDLSLSF
jgi:hypothetical protein